ncbi:MAG TPA: KH domain-containing protein [archaeon]|nr:KH domain-containing protein [archaeon]
MEDSEILLVPHDRLGAIIGKSGSTRKEIESRTGTKITIDSAEGEVEITRKSDPLGYFKALRIVKAIARGFSPEHAYRLLNEECIFELIELQEELGKNQSRMKAKKGRVIGAHGAAREEIEEDTGANISVYGKTIGIIGSEEEVAKAKRAIEMLLGGAAHSMVFSSLRRKQHGEKFDL